MESYRRLENLVKDTFDYLPQYLHKAYPPEVSVTLRNKDDRLPGALLCQGSIPKVRLCDGYNLTPVFCAHFFSGFTACSHNNKLGFNRGVTHPCSSLNPWSV